MKRGMEINEFMEELKRRDEAKRDFIAPTSLLAMTDEARMLVGTEDRTFPVNDFAHGQIASRLQIPKQYYDRMREDYPQLLASNINGWFQKNPETRMVRTLDGNVRAFLSDRYRTIDNLDVVNAVMPIISKAGITSIGSADITESRLYIQALSERVMAEVKVGDVVQAGILVSNSEVGAGSVKLEGLIYRLVCLNLAVRPERIRKYHIGGRAEIEPDHLYTDSTRMAIDATFLLKLKDVATAMLDQGNLNDYVLKLREADEQKIEKDEAKRVDEIIEVSAKKFGFSQGEGLTVMENLMREGAEGNFSKYGFSNAVTRTAEDIENYDRAVEMERIGGEIIEMSKPEWDKIWKAEA